nr:hypothetical protein GCM10020241_00600 [Streptoalloteichus tenebrarius]
MRWRIPQNALITRISDRKLRIRQATLVKIAIWVIQLNGSVSTVELISGTPPGRPH